MKKDIFEYHNYKAYLEALIGSKPKRGRGIRMEWARASACPYSHISQVMLGNSHLSMEQAEATNQYFGHTEEEANFFLLLVQLARAGTASLKSRLERQIEQVLERRLVLKDRLGVKAGVSREDQATFYSSWHYGAIHVMLSIEKFQTKDSIARYLGISLKRVGEVLEFLTSVGLAVPRENGQFGIGTGRIHLESDSPMISKFHTNWRMRAIQSLDREDSHADLHYSSAITISESDFKRVKALLVNYINEIKTIIRESKEEGAHCFSVDLFRL